LPLVSIRVTKRNAFGGGKKSFMDGCHKKNNKSVNEILGGYYVTGKSTGSVQKGIKGADKGRDLSHVIRHL
jgi:hypothetical protein